MISIKDCQQDDASYNAYNQKPKTCQMQTIRLVLYGFVSITNL